MFNIIEKRRWFFLASGILVILSIAALVVSAVQSGAPLQLDPASSISTGAAGLAIVIAAVLILVYLWWTFRDVPGALRYGACTTTIISHNLLTLLGFYALMGLLAGWKVDTPFLIAALAVIGLSVQGVIATFSRIREGVSRHKDEPYQSVVNRSILEALTPSLVTRLCAMLILVPITLFGRATIQPFTATLLVGILCETYSSIFVATMLMTI